MVQAMAGACLIPVQLMPTRNPNESVPHDHSCLKANRTGRKKMGEGERWNQVWRAAPVKWHIHTDL